MAAVFIAPRAPSPGPRAPTPGRTDHKSILTATPLGLSQDGRDVLAVHFDLHRPLDDPAMLFMRWYGDVFRPIVLAAMSVA